MRNACFLGIAALVVSCTTAPEIPARPNVAMAEASGVPLARLERGRVVYLTECTRCHEAQLPDDVSKEDWHVVLPGMAWNAGISAADEEAVRAYIMAVKQSAG